MRAIQSDSDIDRAVRLLGGELAMGRKVTNALEVHAVLTDGLPVAALQHLVASASIPEMEEVLPKVLGIPHRTFRQMKTGTLGKRLSPVQSSQAWQFAIAFSHAVEVLGSDEAASEWMMKPAVGFSDLRPIDLVATSAGVGALEEYLTRMEFGVYM